MNKMIQDIEWNDETVNNFWDFYSQYPELYFTYQYGEKIAEVLYPFMTPQGHVLDYGCGTGFLIKHLLDKPIKTFGTDSSPASVTKVKNMFGHEATFGGVYSIEEILSNKKFHNFFDAVCLIEVVEHLSDQHLATVMDNVKKFLKKNGKILITTPNEEDLSASFVYCPLSKKVYHRWQHVRSWSSQSLASYLKLHGFTPLSVFSTDFSSVNTGTPSLRTIVKKIISKTGLLKVKEYKGPHLVYVGNNQ
jgi:SAM-dependent methyltransferase